MWQLSTRPCNHYITFVQDEIPELDKETITNAIAEESQKEKLAEFNKWGRPIRHNAEYKVRDIR